MPKINCGECARAINQYGCIPDQCMPGYKLFLDPYTRPDKFCERCGLRLKKARSEKYSNEYRKVYLECPKHGVVGYLDAQFVRVKK